MAKKNESASRSLDELNLIALAYDREGQLLSRGDIDGDTAYFDLDEEQLRYSRVFVLPDTPEEEGAPPLDQLSLEAIERRISYEPVVRLADGKGVRLGTIPDFILDRWWWARCCVRGTVTKSFNIDGINQDRPVCNAIVHVCEVDRLPRLVYRIPDNILDRFRHEVLFPIPEPDPIPQPIPRPDIDLGPVIPTGPRPVPGPTRLLDQVSDLTRPNLAIQTDLQALSLQPKTKLISDELANQLRSANAQQLRQIIIADFPKFYPIFCYFPFIWPYIYRCDEVAVTRTDQNGRYEACFWYQRFFDQPDVYVWVQYEIDGVPETVYRPSIACHTRWNYNCGEDIDIKVTDNRVPLACDPPLQGSIAWVKSIGWNAPVSRIEQNMNAQINLPQGGKLRTVGLSDLATGGLNDGLKNQKVRPFATSIPFIVQFGSGFPSNKVSYYRWSYRKIRNEKLQNASGEEQQWKPLDFRAISKGYTVEEAGPGGVTVFKTKQYQLGPFDLGPVKAYKIPPVSPKVPAVSGDPTAEWSQNTVTMVVNTASLLGNGLYEFKLEFYNQAGVRQNVADTVNQISNPSNPGQSQPATSDFLTPTLLDSFRPFRMKVRIDNAPCEAAIYPVQIAGNTASTNCGFLKYGTHNKIRIRFKADHPNGFGYFNWRINRGYSGSTIGSTSGTVKDDTNNYDVNAGGIYENLHADDGSRTAVTVSGLLDGCDKAAFAQHLYVDGLHTNGTNVLNNFDRSALAAFALEP